jgi:hypothetical protein
MTNLARRATSADPRTSMEITSLRIIEEYTFEKSLLGC